VARTANTALRKLVIGGMLLLLPFCAGQAMMMFPEPIARYLLSLSFDYVYTDRLHLAALTVIGIGGLIATATVGVWILYVNKVTKR
jgi:hypothetical protein